MNISKNTVITTIKKSKKLLGSLSVLLFALSLSACGGGEQKTQQTGESKKDSPFPPIEVPFKNPVTMTGAGATFPAALYQNWFVSLNRMVPELQVNYQSVGSGAGIEQFRLGTVDFGASDVAMTDEQMAEVSRGVLLLPVTAGGIVFAYNLPGVEKLQLSRDTYVGISLGTITRWNDPKIVADNPDVTLPDSSITFVHRSDGSGTTGFFTKHLSAISDEWKEKVGQGTTVQWGSLGGTFLGARGNEGVTATIQQTDGAIGYIEYGYAVKNKIPKASLQNKSGAFVYPEDATTSATLAVVELPENLRAFITDPDGADSYPIVTYSWILAYKTYDDPNKAIAMETMIQYALTYGQEVATDLGYIRLPQNVIEKVAEVADQISPDFTIRVN